MQHGQTRTLCCVQPVPLIVTYEILIRNERLKQFIIRVVEIFDFETKEHV